jgi:hypothetical protein
MSWLVVVEVERGLSYRGFQFFAEVDEAFGAC